MQNLHTKWRREIQMRRCRGETKSSVPQCTCTAHMTCGYTSVSTTDLQYLHNLTSFLLPEHPSRVLNNARSDPFLSLPQSQVQPATPSPPEFHHNLTSHKSTSQSQSTNTHKTPPYSHPKPLPRTPIKNVQSHQICSLLQTSGITTPSYMSKPYIHQKPCKTPTLLLVATYKYHTPNQQDLEKETPTDILLPRNLLLEHINNPFLLKK